MSVFLWTYMNITIRIWIIMFIRIGLLVLNAGNGWEWGLLGLQLITTMDHSLIPSLWPHVLLVQSINGRFGIPSINIYHELPVVKGVGHQSPLWINQLMGKGHLSGVGFYVPLCFTSPNSWGYVEIISNRYGFRWCETNPQELGHQSQALSMSPILSPDH